MNKPPRYHSHWRSRARFRHQSGIPDESRLSGNGEESRFRLSRQGLSGNTRGPVTSDPSAPPRTSRRLSETSGGDFFPVIVFVRFAVAPYHTGNPAVCQVLFSGNAALAGVENSFAP